MRMQSHPSCEALSRSLLQRLEEVSECLEAAWKAGQRPRIEDYLGSTPEPARSVLLRDLLALELALRRQRNEAPLLEDYLQRFPEHAELVHAAFAEEPASAGQLSAQVASLHPWPETGPLALGAVAVDHPLCLGRYRIMAQLGAGGFALVYRGYDEELRRDVAIKVPHRRRISQSEDAGLFIAEARILASLDHPNIVPVHDVGRAEDGSSFVVSKFIEGSDLAKKLKESPRSLM